MAAQVEHTESGDTTRPSTRRFVVDARFAELLSSDSSIPTPVILRALEGEPKRAAIEVALWASIHTDPSGALLSWAQKHGTGAFRRTPRRRNMTPAQTRAALDARHRAVA